MKKTVASPGLSRDQVQKLSYLAGRIARDELDPEEAFRHILEFAVEVTGSDLGSIHLLDKAKSELRIAAIKGVPLEPILGSAYPLDYSLSGTAVKTAQPIIVNDVQADAHYVKLFTDVRSELVVPLIVGTDVVGVLNLESSDSSHFDEEDARIVEIFASLLAATFRSGELSRLRSTPAARTADPKANELVFVLMPFRDPFNKYYRAIFRPAVEDAGFVALRSDEIFGPTEIIRDLWGSIHNARVVLAELTGRNPNVMYEVGLSHGLGKPVVLVAQSMEDVPFDLRSLRCILYDTTDPEWATRLRSDITNSVRVVISADKAGPYPSKDSDDRHD